MRAEVFLHHCFQPSLRTQNVFHRVARRAFAARTLGHVVGFVDHFLTRVGNRDCQAALSHHRNVNDVVAHKAGFFFGQAFLLQDLHHGRKFVHAALLDEIELQVAPADGNRLRTPARDDADLDPAHTRQGNTNTIVRVEAFGFHRGAPTRIRQEEDVSVGHYPVNVEQDDLDLLSAWYRHAFIITAAFSGYWVLSTGYSLYGETLAKLLK